MANTVFSKIKLPNSDQSWYKYGIYPVKGTQTATTGTWTGTIDLPQLYDGLTIAYYLPTTGSGNATLNLTLAGGTTTGAVNVYWNGANRMTTHYPAGSTILLTYWSAGSIKVNGTATTDNRWTHCDYDSNSNTWRNIQLNGTQILGTGTSTGALNFVPGSGVSITNSSGSVTIAHADTSTQASVNNSGRTYIQDITLDDYGHVTGLTSATETVTNTDTKVTSVSNHYAPAEDSSAQLSASASGATAAWSIDVVKGITIKRDAKGHVTGVAVTSGKIPANPNTNTTYTLSSGTNNGTLKLTPSSGSAQDNVKVTGWDNMATKSYVDGLVANATHFCGSFNASNGKINGGSNTLTSVAEKVGDMYTCDTAGTYLSQAYEVGDSIIFKNAVAASTAPVAADIISVEKTVSVTQTLTSGTKIGTVEGVDLYCQTNTDTKVTAVGNHYTPATASGQDKTASASGATAAWSIDVVKGVTLNTDGKGHVTGLSVTSGKIPANPNTDTKVTTTELNPSSTTKYYPNFNSGAGTGGLNFNNGFAYNTKEGTASAVGCGELVLGNLTTKGTAGNKYGSLAIYSESSGYGVIHQADTTSGLTHILPATGGTILNTGTTSFTQTLSSGTKIGTIKINGTNTDLYCQTNTDTKVNVTLGTTTKAYLLATSTTPTSTAQGVTSIADTGVYLGTTAGELVATKISATAGVNVNTANSNVAGGLALYSNDPTAYGVTMRGTAISSGQLGKHGYVQGDWAGYFCFAGASNRGYIFRHAGANVASISGGGNMVLNGSITLGGNSGNTSGCRQVYNSTTETLDFIFVS